MIKVKIIIKKVKMIRMRMKIEKIMMKKMMIRKKKMMVMTKINSRLLLKVEQTYNLNKILIIVMWERLSSL